MITYQTPNKELIVMLVAAVVGMVTQGWVNAAATAVFYLSGATWSYLEIFHGVNSFRRGLGIVVAVYLLAWLATRLHG